MGAGRGAGSCRWRWWVGCLQILMMIAAARGGAPPAGASIPLSGFGNGSSTSTSSNATATVSSTTSSSTPPPPPPATPLSPVAGDGDTGSSLDGAATIDYDQYVDERVGPISLWVFVLLCVVVVWLCIFACCCIAYFRNTRATTHVQVEHIVQGKDPLQGPGEGEELVKLYPVSSNLGRDSSSMLVGAEEVPAGFAGGDASMQSAIARQSSGLEQPFRAETSFKRPAPQSQTYDPLPSPAARTSSSLAETPPLFSSPRHRNSASGLLVARPPVGDASSPHIPPPTRSSFGAGQNSPTGKGRPSVDMGSKVRL